MRRIRIVLCGLGGLALLAGLALAVSLAAASGARTSPAAGHTVAQILSQLAQNPAALDGQTVVVRGTLVHLNPSCGLGPGTCYAGYLLLPMGTAMTSVPPNAPSNIPVSVARTPLLYLEPPARPARRRAPGYLWLSWLQRIPILWNLSPHDHLYHVKILYGGLCARRPLFCPVGIVQDPDA